MVKVCLRQAFLIMPSMSIPSALTSQVQCGLLSANMIRAEVGWVTSH